MNFKRLAFVAFGLAIGGCVSTQEMPLAPNIVRLDTQASGLLFTGQAVPQTMRAAATATLNRGYTHFKFAEAGLQQGSQVTGVVGSSDTHVSGTYGRGYFNASANTFSSASVIRAPTTGVGVTVIMFHSDEPGAKDAFDADQVLRQYSR
jgi:hypothetical protein